ncbi:MAG: hypothetical protein DHS20C12_06300 [Pseudohongiella sp.]|nr:MAG: hypothetical protein DHS20C12_06300 [Pseudohongiella sp.]
MRQNLRPYFLGALLLLLTSCAASGPKFASMSPAEIIAYNRSADYLDRVYCSERVGTGSHIRRQECNTYRDILEGKVGTLDTPSSSRTVIYSD